MQSKMNISIIEYSVHPYGQLRASLSEEEIADTKDPG